MLYGNRKIQDEILGKVKEFEEKYNKKVVFGAMVGSISKGVERYDSDYDTRFLYLDQSAQGFVRWDRVKEDIKERQIHQCYIPDSKDCFVDGVHYHDKQCEFMPEDKGLFYDKIAFWELTSFINFLRNPKLDNKFSVGLYHIVGWTFNSPFCWDPYGIKSKISCLLDEMFIKEYEIQYYRNYIQNTLKKSPVMLREYLYSSYYALAIQYCIKHEKFAPVYFRTLLAMCNNEKIEDAILKLEKRYYSSVAEKVQEGKLYERKMANSISVEKSSIIDNFLEEILKSTEVYYCDKIKENGKDYVERIISIILDSLNRPIVKDINEEI